MFKPHSLLASQIVPTAANYLAGRPRLLRPSRTCVVTFARIGYAIRLTSGNWRNEDFHLARFAALSAAHTLDRQEEPSKSFIVVSRTPPWLASGRGCRGRRLSRVRRSLGMR